MMLCHHLQFLQQIVKYLVHVARPVLKMLILENNFNEKILFPFHEICSSQKKMPYNITLFCTHLVM